MQSGTLCSGVLTALIWLLLVMTPTHVLAQEDGEEDRGLTQEELEEAFWPAWNQFIADITESSIHTNPDPWESWNRKVFVFNDTADRWVFKPVAKTYHLVTPDVVETGVDNVFANLFELSTIFNSLLQAKFGQAASDTGRFLINSTLGLAGLFDVATPLGLEKHNEDFGQTLGYWGVGSGPYLMVPFFGGYTLRSGAGSITHTFLTDPVHYIDPTFDRYATSAARLVAKRANLLAAEDLITGDRYSFIRDAYLQQREYLVNDGEVEDTFGEQDFEDDWLEQWDEPPPEQE